MKLIKPEVLAAQVFKLAVLAAAEMLTIDKQMNSREGAKCKKFH